MADAVATYAVKLEDGVSASSEAAAGALEKLRSAIKSDTSALREMEAAQKRLRQAQVVDMDAYLKLAVAIKAKKQALADSQAKAIALGGALGGTANSAKKAASLVDRLREAAQGAPGPLSGLVARFASLQKLVGSGVVAVGIIAITAAVLALSAATAILTTKLFGYAVASADARRSELLHLEGLTKLRFWYQAAAMSATELQAATDGVSANVAIGRDQVGRYTEQLYRAGLRGQNLADALEAVSIKASVQGEAAASAFAGWAAGTAMAGGSVKRLADDVRARLGPIAARQMLSLTVQTAKLKESFAALFNGLNVEPLLRGVQSVTSLFSQSTASGRALKAILTVLFQPVINGAEGAGLLVKRFFQGMMIAALTFGIMVLRVRNYLRDTFGGSQLFAWFDAQKAAVYAGMAAFVSFAAVLGVVGLALTALAVPFAVVGAWFALVGFAAVKGYELIASIEWMQLGVDICNGIVNGVKSGAAWVVDSLKSLGSAAYGAFKKALQIASPSKAFAKLGVEIPAGVAAGVQKGTPAARASVASMIDATTANGAREGSAAPASAAAAPAPSLSVTVENITVQTQATNAPDIAASIREPLANVLEGLLVQLGGSRPVGA